MRGARQPQPVPPAEEHRARRDEQHEHDEDQHAHDDDEHERPPRHPRRRRGGGRGDHRRLVAWRRALEPRARVREVVEPEPWRRAAPRGRDHERVGARRHLRAAEERHAVLRRRGAGLDDRRGRPAVERVRQGEPRLVDGAVGGDKRAYSTREAGVRYEVIKEDIAKH